MCCERLPADQSLKVNSADSEPLRLRTCSLSPGMTFLPAFLPIKLVFGFSGSFLVSCCSPRVTHLIRPIVYSSSPLHRVSIDVVGNRLAHGVADEDVLG